MMHKMGWDWAAALQAPPLGGGVLPGAPRAGTAAGRGSPLPDEDVRDGRGCDQAAQHQQAEHPLHAAVGQRGACK